MIRNSLPLGSISDWQSWQAWLAFLAALFALPMDAEQLAIYRDCTGRKEPPDANSPRGMAHLRPSRR